MGRVIAAGFVIALGLLHPAGIIRALASRVVLVAMFSVAAPTSYIAAGPESDGVQAIRPSVSCQSCNASNRRGFLP